MNNHTEMKAVLEVINNYVDGTFNADIEKLKGVFHEKAVMNGYLGPDCLIATPRASLPTSPAPLRWLLRVIRTTLRSSRSALRATLPR